MAASVIGYVWEAATGRFRGPGGRFLSITQVRSVLDTAIAGSARDARAIADAFNAGTIGVPEFERQMQQLMKDTHIYATAVASGGFNAMDASDIAALEQQLRSQFQYLSDFADDLASGRVSRASPSRTAMYAKAATSTYDQVYRAGQITRGFSQERNILHPGEHCDGCTAETERGWVRVGTLVPIGLRRCLTNCNCTTDYR